MNFYGPPACANQHVKFDQNGQQARFTWDLNEDTTITYSTVMLTSTMISTEILMTLMQIFLNTEIQSEKMCT